jgi:hypothetical protein
MQTAHTTFKVPTFCIPCILTLAYTLIIPTKCAISNYYILWIRLCYVFRYACSSGRTTRQFSKSLLKSVQPYLLHHTYVHDEADSQTEPTDISFVWHFVFKKFPHILSLKMVHE